MPCSTIMLDTERFHSNVTNKYRTPFTSSRISYLPSTWYVRCSVHPFDGGEKKDLPAEYTKQQTPLGSVQYGCVVHTFQHFPRSKVIKQYEAVLSSILNSDRSSVQGSAAVLADRAASMCCRSPGGDLNTNESQLPTRLLQSQTGWMGTDFSNHHVISGLALRKAPADLQRSCTQSWDGWMLK